MLHAPAIGTTGWIMNDYIIGGLMRAAHSTALVWLRRRQGLTGDTSGHPATQ